MCKCRNPCADLNCGNDMPDSRSPAGIAAPGLQLSDSSQPDTGDPNFCNNLATYLRSQGWQVSKPSQPGSSGQPKFLELSYAGTVDRHYGQGKREIYYLKSEVDEYLAKLSQPVPACTKDQDCEIHAGDCSLKQSQPEYRIPSVVMDELKELRILITRVLITRVEHLAARVNTTEQYNTRQDLKIVAMERRLSDLTLRVSKIEMWKGGG